MKIVKNKTPRAQSLLAAVQWLPFLWVLVISIMAGIGLARAQVDAYSVEVAVADRSANEQNAAYKVAFRRVLLDNSGDKTLLNRNDVRKGLNNAEEYVAAFTYRTPPPGTVISVDTPITPLVRSSGEATQLMMVTFDRVLVRELIDSKKTDSDEKQASSAGAAQSNSALVWLLIQDNGRDIRISDTAAVNVQSRAREIAGALGISLVLPSGDQQDRASLTITDLLNVDSDAIKAASERYEQRTILAGSLRRNGNRGWRGQWLKLVDGQESESGFDATSLDDALQQGISLLAGEGAGDSSFRYGGPANSDTEGLVWVGSMQSLSDYASVMRFLEAVPNVGTVYPKEVGDTTMVFAVFPRASLRDIEDAAAGQSWIRRTMPSMADSIGGLSGSADLALELDR